MEPLAGPSVAEGGCIGVDAEQVEEGRGPSLGESDDAHLGVAEGTRSERSGRQLRGEAVVIAGVEAARVRREIESQEQRGVGEVPEGVPVHELGVAELGGGEVSWVQSPPLGRRAGHEDRENEETKPHAIRGRPVQQSDRQGEHLANKP